MPGGRPTREACKACSPLPPPTTPPVRDPQAPPASAGPAPSAPVPPPGPDPAHVLLGYTTDTNSTRQMAESVARGVRSVPGIELTVRLLATGEEVAPGDMAPFDGLIIETPTRHRNMHHRVKLFVERVVETLWVSDAMALCRAKLARGCTPSGPQVRAQRASMVPKA